VLFHQGLDAARKARQEKAEKKAAVKKSRLENLAKARANKNNGQKSEWNASLPWSRDAWMKAWNCYVHSTHRAKRQPGVIEPQVAIDTKKTMSSFAYNAYK